MNTCIINYHPIFVIGDNLILLHVLYKKHVLCSSAIYKRSLFKLTINIVENLLLSFSISKIA